MTAAHPREDDRQERFRRLAALVHEPLQRYALRRVEPADVDDIVAETLLVLWRRLDEVPADAELPWCYNVARNCVANLRRSETRRGRLIRRLAGEAPAAAGLDGARLELGPDLHGALASLRVKDREVVLLWAWEGLAPREIAIALGTSANAVSLRLSRAKRRLRAYLSHDEPGQDPTGAGQITGVSGKEAR
ncbi:RNA polymerase sigma factor [Phytohabitans rumicis]|uniref:DNA-directed RNA polymerase sigma-70 factor n=1 Tax=Phytohabitans rumicis TaxID=1076125 RepID=A0A6V8LCE2_9ACTN|nr:sigma-70 family RNA polymerase sigma factor [Phytohabitans rumicis]GFJ94024.1 DNA-directed RNA polymerase sigma-70 factor [Phytohabitans rumicis]